MAVEWLFPLIFVAGFVDSIAGGGGLISLTAYLAAGLPAHMALGTNKFSAVAGTGIATARFAKSGHICLSSAAMAFAGAAVGSTLGARCALYVDERVLRWLLILVIPVVAFIYLRYKDFGVREKALPRNKTLLYSLLVGLLVGFYDGFFGPGTGTFLIMAFTGILGFGLLTACGNAKVVNFASNLTAVAVFVWNHQVDYRLGIPCAVCGILGNYLGSGLAMKKGAKVVRPMMFVVVGLLVAKNIWDMLAG